MLTKAVLALLIFAESRNYLRSRWSSGSLNLVIYVHKKDCTTKSEMRLEKYQGRLGCPVKASYSPLTQSCLTKHVR